jgi:hypothetical protein
LISKLNNLDILKKFYHPIRTLHQVDIDSCTVVKVLDPRRGRFGQEIKYFQYRVDDEEPNASDSRRASSQQAAKVENRY